MHTWWGEKEGAPSGILALAQTADGYLWLGSANGLYRFDGVRFERYEPRSDTPFPSGAVSSLMSLTNGDLWIGFRNGTISRLRKGRADNYTVKEGVPGGRVLGLAQDRDGTIWAAAGNGLGRFDGRQWTKVGADWHFNGKAAHTVFLDREGTLWVATENTLLVLRPHGKAFEPTGIAVGYVAKITQAANGRLWMAEISRSVRPIPVPGDRQPNETEIQVGSGDILFDRDGALWVTTVGDGLRRAVNPEQLKQKVGQFSTAVESFTTTDRLTDNNNRAILQDREGTIWVGTNSGLDQFRAASILPVPLPINPGQATIAAGDRGDVFVNSVTWMFHLDGRSTSKIKSGVSSVSAYRDRSGGIWWTEAIGLTRLHGGRLSIFRLPEGSFVPGYMSGAVHVTEDHNGVLWVGSERHGLWQLKERTWTRFDLPASLAELAPAAAFTDWQGRVWFGYGGGTVIAVERDQVKVVAANLNSVVGDVGAINGRGQHVWVGGERGLAVFDGQVLQPIRPNDAPSFGRIAGIEETADGSLWVSETRGLLRVAAADVLQVLRDPGHRVQFEAFTSTDGLPGTFRSMGQVGGMTQGTDGRLWFMATGGLAWLHPAKLTRNTLPPPVAVRSITAGGQRFAIDGNLTLPARTKDVRIDYTALSLAVPERVRFRYRLDGSDHDWQDAGGRREAFYTNLGPRAYRFRVIAANNDGVWNDTGAVLAFTIAPAWYQTRWFMLLCICAGLAIVGAAYRLRVRQIAHAMSARFDERLAERTRVARELHDTFLQTVQGSKLVAEHALKNAGDHGRLVRALEQLSDWLGRATEEGRAALHSLRGAATVENDLAEALRRAMEECRALSGMEGSLSVTGQPRELHPLVHDEVYRIGYEAIRNACTHSGGNRVAVTVDYAHDLTLRVSDDGGGIDQAVSEKGKPGHFGVSGMRERAARIGGEWTVATASTSGTLVTLVVPGRLAFQAAGLTDTKV